MEESENRVRVLVEVMSLMQMNRMDVDIKMTSGIVGIVMMQMVGLFIGVLLPILLTIFVPLEHVPW